MPYHLEVALFGALILLFTLRRKRRPHKRHGGTLVVLAITIEFLLIALGILSLFSGLFLDVDLTGILTTYLPLLR